MYRWAKRTFDVVLSLLGLIISIPLWIAAVIGIEISDPGPVFYMAQRIGRDNKPFRMFKFRSMRVDDKADEKNFKAAGSRIFPFGEVMRRYKIDELPQLINIILGDMSIVGPRPAARDQLDIVRGGRFSRTAEVPPGLTGPGALLDYIYGDAVESEEEYIEKVLSLRLELELYYIDARGPLYDLKMIWYTVVCIFCRVIGREPERAIRELRGCAEDRNQTKTEKTAAENI